MEEGKIIRRISASIMGNQSKLFQDTNRVKANEIDSLPMAKSTIYLSLYESPDQDGRGVSGKEDKKLNLSVIGGLVQKIFRDNGFNNISVAPPIEQAEISKMKLEPQDAFVSFLYDLDEGKYKGDTQGFMLEDGASPHSSFHVVIDESMSGPFLNISNVVTKFCRLIDETKKANEDVLIGFIAAHEILHQYLIKCSLMLNGEISSLVHQDSEGHYNSIPGYLEGIVLPNLNLSGDKAASFLVGRQKVEINRKNVFDIFNIVPSQKAYLNAYFKGIVAGINPVGKDAKEKSQSVELFNQEIQKIFKK